MKKEISKSKFTDADVRNFKTDKRMEDKLEGDGFGVRVYGTGTKIFYYAYSFDGKRRFLNLGEYKPLTLAEARKRHTAAKAKIDNGIDPLLEKDTAKAERKIMPFVADFVTEYINTHCKTEKRGWQEIERALKAEIVPQWGKRKMSDIKKRDLKLILDKIKERGAPVMANRVLAYTRKMFNYAINDCGIEMINPFLMMKLPNTETPRERVLNEIEIKLFWNNLDGCKMGEPLKRALRLILVTGQRPGEVIGMHRNEINGDWWEIPSERSKNKLSHRVFLTATAKKLIGDATDYIFESPILENQPYGVRTMTHAIKDNLPHTPESKVKDRLQIPHFTPHDARRTCATMLSKIGFIDDVINSVLNHKKVGIIGTYNKNQYDAEKRAALTEWEMKLTCILTDTEYRNELQRKGDAQREADKQAQEGKQSNVVDIKAARRRKAA